MSEIIYKQAPVNLEPSDNDGYLIGYANMYNVKDLQGDISAPNSFIKTVTERRAKIKIYRKLKVIENKKSVYMCGSISKSTMHYTDFFLIFYP